jgi:hypothetical protein
MHMTAALEKFSGGYGNRDLQQGGSSAQEISSDGR